MKKKYLSSFLLLMLLFVSHSGLAQNRLSDNEYGTLIQNWLDIKKSDFSLTSGDVSDLQISDAYYSGKTKINHVYVNQAYQGVKIHNAVSSIAVRNNSMFNFGNGFISNVASKVNVITPAITPLDAISSVVSMFNLAAVNGLEEISASSNNKYLFSSGGVSKVNIPVQLVFQPTLDGSLRLAWDLSIYTLSGKNWYSVRVDAVTGAVLDTNDWIVSCNFGDNHSNHNNHVKEEPFSLLRKDNSLLVDGSQYNVFTIPTESPDHGPIQLISEPADDVASPLGWHDTNGVLGAEFTITRGNNVWAQEDVAGTNSIGFSPDGGTMLNFNFPFNGDQAPLGFQDVAITNLFYMNNIMHDVWYQYGFDEASGNFQQNNYGNGGNANDFVFADAQDGSGINNALFGTPPDGNSPSMTMFLWNAVGLGQPLTINSGGPILGSITAGIPSTANGANGIGNITGPSDVPVTANLVLVDDGSFVESEEGCTSLINGAAINGNIAVVKRGNCPFTDKIQFAQDAGAIGVIVVNHNNPTGDPNYVDYVSMYGVTNPVFTIPSVFINNADGELLITALQNATVINGTIQATGPFQKDGSLDNVIVGHEYGHGISARLIGGPSNVSCLNNAEQMGEGWSDWFAMMITMEATDLPETGRGIGTYAISQPTNGGGIRPFPYSTDITINPVTYADTNDETGFSQPHGIGSIWASILWDLTWAYVGKYGFDADVYNGTGGNNKAMQLVLDGLKLQVCNTGFVGGRDALLLADTATGGDNQCLIWEVFAARGVGLNASEGTAALRTDQIEDFTTPPDTDPTLANCTSLSVDEFGIASQYSIFPNPANNMLSIKVKKNFGKVSLTLVDINGRQVISTEANLLDQVDLNISALQSGLYILNIKGEGINVNEKIIKK